MQLTVIQNKIYEIRGQKVMLDFDLAELYATETKFLKRAVRRNLKRFPPDFMFELTKEEWETLRYQIGTSKEGGRGGTRYLPFSFTEHGVTMLAAVLNSDKAIEMNIAIVRAFVALKQLAVQQRGLAAQLEEIRNHLGEHDAQLNSIYDAIENLLDEKTETKTWQQRERIGFKTKKD